MQDGDEFDFNDSFTAPLYRIKVHNFKLPRILSHSLDSSIVYDEPKYYFSGGAGECNPDERDSRREHKYNRESIPGPTIPG